MICNQLTIDHDFLETYQIKLLAGRNFSLEDRTSYGYRGPVDPNKNKVVMVNKAAAMLLGFATVEDALNKKIIFQLLQMTSLVVIELIWSFISAERQARLNINDCT